MSAKKSTAAAAKEETAETAEVTETAAKAVQEAAAEAAEPVAYIGPSIRHIAKSGTVYTGGLPATLNEKVKEIPAIKGLLIPVSQLATALQARNKTGTALNNLYEAVSAKLQK